jgi:hypothetical protein
MMTKIKNVIKLGTLLTVLLVGGCKDEPTAPVSCPPCSTIDFESQSIFTSFWRYAPNDSVFKRSIYSQKGVEFFGKYTNHEMRALVITGGDTAFLTTEILDSTFVYTSDHRHSETLPAGDYPHMTNWDVRQNSNFSGNVLVLDNIDVLVDVRNSLCTNDSMDVVSFDISLPESLLTKTPNPFKINNTSENSLPAGVQQSFVAAGSQGTRVTITSSESIDYFTWSGFLKAYDNLSVSKKK